MAPKVDPQNLRKTFGRFRVLIVGRANAGKTTILQKVCNTTEKPEIYNAKGDKVCDMFCTMRRRGKHDITNEMVFKSNPGFVFHDSCGFEAGSVGEFEDMKKFIAERANTTKLEERIHAVWYCIPMDDHCRTFQRSEEKFFSECDTGHVPVIVVFTKFDALHPVAFGELEEQLIGLSQEECLKRIDECVEELFTSTGVLDRLYAPENLARPKCYVRLQSELFSPRLICLVCKLTWVIRDMDEVDTGCDTLLENTTFALDDKELCLCLVSTQQSNLELCIKCAIE
ncbi:GTP-binding protein [Suillus paluster]|uniref:GTP-binding protein n=1 Tax=Suillus paluster TaxID=48578 RepID=UPI001B8667E9|nr:GTP-binding protein [Suillus paluster]KAG1728725.1 GTP-binding protein [Suillus paluster]